MPDYRIPCADGKEITVSFGPSDEIQQVLRNLKRYHGLDPHMVMAEVLGTFTSARLVFDTDPSEIHSMLMAFWVGYQMADRSTRYAG